MFRYCLTLILMLATLPALSAEDPNIRDLMTAEEFAASGLSRLTRDEMEAINRWLVRYTAQDAVEMIDTEPLSKNPSKCTEFISGIPFPMKANKIKSRAKTMNT